MKILLLTYEFPPVSGGIATYCAALASAAVKRGHHVTVAASGGFERDDSEMENYSFEIKRSGKGIYSAGKLPALIWRTYRWAHRGGYDLIHAVDWPHIMALALLNRFKSIPFAATYYGSDILMAPSSRQIRFLAKDRFFSAPARIFVISDFSMKLLLEHNRGIDPNAVIMTPLGVDFEHFANPRGNCDFRSKYSIPHGNKIILTVARLDERKGHKAALEAMRTLPPKIKERLSYIIAGTGIDNKYSGELRYLADRSGVNVIFAGRIDHEDLPSLYAACDIFCMVGQPHPGKVEGFGLAYLEAAAARLPSIAGRIGGAPEVVIEGDTGLIVEPGDIEGIARAIITLTEDESLRFELGRKAQERARGFTWEKCVDLTYGSAA